MVWDCSLICLALVWNATFQKSVQNGWTIHRLKHLKHTSFSTWSLEAPFSLLILQIPLARCLPVDESLPIYVPPHLSVSHPGPQVLHGPPNLHLLQLPRRYSCLSTRAELIVGEGAWQTCRLSASSRTREPSNLSTSHRQILAGC